ncbi:MAG: hypothetical protein ACI396_09305 [Acutalibacteraceae bacterium]
MNSIDILREIANENNGIILTKTAADKGITRSNLSKLYKNGKITRIANGQYIFSDELHDEMLSLQLHSKYIVFSHESALFLNGISERTPFEHTITIPTSKTLPRSISNQCKIYYIKDEFWELGKTELKTTLGNLVWSYDIDRTICDIIRSRNRISDETFISSLKLYAASQNKNLTNLSIYAEKMKILSLVRKNLEVLL